MALVMVHLLIAREWASLHPRYADSPEYYFGSISPDAIHVRDGNDKTHKNEVHFGNWQTSKPELLRDYAVHHRTDFDVGYLVHCLTDGIWVDGYKAAFPGILLPDGRANPVKYYNDVYATEKALFRFEGVPRMFELIRAASTPTDHPMLRAEEFDAWRENVLHEYDPERPAIGAWRQKSYREMGLPEPKDEDPVYITPAYIRGFLASACERIDEIIRRYPQP